MASHKRKGNPQLQVRLPREHWIWEMDPKMRSLEVQKALDFYRRYHDAWEEMRANLEEIKQLIASGAAGSIKEKDETDNRLFETLDKFLNI